jgi:undecaprenyl-diphosphatase
MALLKIIILACIQGAAELLPVSSSAHVIVAEKLMGLDPTSPEMTMLLVMLHTGTMLAVIVYFWNSWKEHYFISRLVFWKFAKLVVLATVLTGFVGLILKFFIEKIVLRRVPDAEVELLFGNLTLIAVSLAAVGLFIIIAGIRSNRITRNAKLGTKSSAWIGIIQGLCLPFRGFSRSGATISTGLIQGLDRIRVEEFSFALAVVLTPAVIIREALRLLRAQNGSLSGEAGPLFLFTPSLLGLIFSFIAGLLALKWLSRWLDQGRWQLFGYYCLGAAIVVFCLRIMGF